MSVKNPIGILIAIIFGSTVALGIFAMSKIMGHLVHDLKWFSIFFGSLTSFTYTTLCSFWHVKLKVLQFVCIHVYTWMCMCGCGARYLQQCLMNTSKMYYHGALFPTLLLSTSLCSVSV